jgi:HPt (histidine-containing phosphotransfer) domain-containing protein
MKGFEEECFAAGYSGYQAKPIEIDKLIDLLAEELGAKQCDQKPSIVHEPLHGELSVDDRNMSSPDKIDPIYSRLGAIPKFHPIIAMFISRVEEQVSAMHKALHEKDFDALINLGHWLKGAGGTVGYDVFTEPAASLEDFAREESRNGCDEVIINIQQLSERLVVAENVD